MRWPVLTQRYCLLIFHRRMRPIIKHTLSRILATTMFGCKAASVSTINSSTYLHDQYSSIKSALVFYRGLYNSLHAWCIDMAIPLFLCYILETWIRQLISQISQCICVYCFYIALAVIVSKDWCGRKGGNYARYVYSYLVILLFLAGFANFRMQCVSTLSTYIWSIAFNS